MLCVRGCDMGVKWLESLYVLHPINANGIPMAELLISAPDDAAHATVLSRSLMVRISGT